MPPRRSRDAAPLTGRRRYRVTPRRTASGNETPSTPEDTNGAATSGLRVWRPGGRGAGTGGPALGVCAHEAQEAKNWMEGHTEIYADAASSLYVTYGAAVGIGGPGGAPRGSSAGPHHGLFDQSSNNYLTTGYFYIILDYLVAIQIAFLYVLISSRAFP